MTYHTKFDTKAIVYILGYSERTYFLDCLKTCLNFHQKNYNASFIPIKLVFEIYADKRSMEDIWTTGCKNIQVKAFYHLVCNLMKNNLT